MRNLYEQSQQTIHSQQYKHINNETNFYDLTQTVKTNPKYTTYTAPLVGQYTYTDKNQSQFQTKSLYGRDNSSKKMSKQSQNMQYLMQKYKFTDQELIFFKKRFDSISQKGILNQKLFRKSMGILGIDHLSYISDRIFLLIDKDQDGKVSFEDYLSYLDTIINGTDIQKAQLSFSFITMNSSDRNKIYLHDIEQMVNQVSLVWKDLSGSTVYPQKQYIESVFRKLDFKQKGFVDFEDYFNTYSRHQHIFSWYELFNGDEMMEKQIQQINVEQKKIQNKVNNQIKKSELCNLKTTSYLQGLNNEVANCLISLKDFENNMQQKDNWEVELQANNQVNGFDVSKQQKHLLSVENCEKVLQPNSLNQLLFINNNVNNNNPNNGSTLFLTSFHHEQNSCINNSFLSSTYQGPLSILQPTQIHLGDQDPEEEEEDINGLAQEKFEMQQIQQQNDKDHQVIQESKALDFLDKLEEKIKMLLNQTEDLEIYLDNLVNKDEGLTTKFTRKTSNSQTRANKGGGLISLHATQRDDYEETIADQRFNQRISSIQTTTKTFNKFSQYGMETHKDLLQKFEFQQSKSLQQRKVTISNIPCHKKNTKTRRNISIYVGHENWNLIFVMMIGIRGSIKDLRNVGMPRQIDPKYFTQKNNKDLIRTFQNDSDFIQYRFTDYAPQIFERIRLLFNITKQTYSKSLGPETLLGNLILGNMTNLSELCSSTKNFNKFQYYSEDAKFVIKAISKEQAQFFFKKILQPYFTYVNNNFHTLLMRLYGLYKIKFNKKGKKIGDSVYFFVTHNIFSTELEIDTRYEIKGSTHNRTARRGNNLSNFDKNTSLKELDLKQDKVKLGLNQQDKIQLLNQLKSDTQFLSKLNIINYYLLLGIHNISVDQQRLSMFKESHILTNSNSTVLYRDRDDTLKFSCSNDSIQQEQQLRFYEKYQSGILSEDEKQVYYFGVLNIFTEYKSTQKLVHSIKSTFYGSSITTIPPNEYQNRLNKFVADQLFN
ncbi:phosphatidylinositol 4-phosphate 5-kinase (macronuclear) [Tetrahymena thermophila SB210]|uniref:Phosphatidylinositol 4-phosphate 5-kinase n=1 Tax=Tetrahymena thermophila (strain SB210) TaxID=312017 RepID=I7MG62_TETTS|nr:phosphatidylinositol 4-phosphate 5-kinase [Tetrahymena thermophila SB210]EAR84890.2 phosphatidylinositol 4-phosphate 5-kinase [Tetrahymena thermophila SB210]|eukprot:XP_001032553.2 phosphatidylinositol 4-phosphate 5-kinase [Tetrahymena thermophila SB210]